MSLPVDSSPHTLIPCIPPSRSESIPEVLPAVPLSFEDLGDDLSVWCDRLVSPDGTENLVLAEQYADTGIALEAIGIRHNGKILVWPGPSLLWAVENGYSGIAEIFIKKGASLRSHLYQYPVSGVTKERLLQRFREGAYPFPLLKSTTRIIRKGFHHPFSAHFSRVAADREDQRMLQLLYKYNSQIDLVYVAKKLGLTSIGLRYPHFAPTTPHDKQELGIMAIKEENIEFLDHALDLTTEGSSLTVLPKQIPGNLLGYAAAKGAPHVLEHLARKYDVNCYAHEPTDGLSGSPLEMALKFNNYTNMIILLNNGADLAYSYRRPLWNQKMSMPTLLHLLCFRRYTERSLLPPGKMLEMRKELLDFLQSYLTEASIRLCLRHYLLKVAPEPEKDFEIIFLLLSYYKDLNPNFDKLDAGERVAYGKKPVKFTHLLKPSVTFLFLHQDVRSFFKDHPGYHAFLRRQGISRAQLAAWNNDVECLTQLVKEGCDLWYTKPWRDKRPGYVVRNEIRYAAFAEGTTPLAVASYNGSLDAIEFILARAGCSGDKVIDAAMLLACKAGQLEVIQLLEKHSHTYPCYWWGLSVVTRHGYLHCMKHLVSKNIHIPKSLDWSDVKGVETYEYIRDVMGIRPQSHSIRFRNCYKNCPDDVLLLLIKDCAGESSCLKRTMGLALHYAIQMKKDEAFINEILERDPELTEDHVKYARSHGYPAIAAKIQRRLHPEVVMIRA